MFQCQSARFVPHTVMLACGCVFVFTQTKVTQNFSQDAANAVLVSVCVFVCVGVCGIVSFCKLGRHVAG